MIDYQAPRADLAQFMIDRAIIDQPTMTTETGHNGSQSDTDLQDAALKIHRPHDGLRWFGLFLVAEW